MRLQKAVIFFFFFFFEDHSPADVAILTTALHSSHAAELKLTYHNMVALLLVLAVARAAFSALSKENGDI